MPTLISSDDRKGVCRHVGGDDSLLGALRRRPLPTATACSYGTNRGGAAGRTGAARPGLEQLARLGALPTLTAADANAAGSRNLPGSAAHPGTSLSDLVATGGSVRPRRPLATPTARDDRSGVAGQALGKNSRPLSEQLGSDQTYRALVGVSEPGGVLNPGWLEPFMGFPVGWTDPAVLVPRWLELPRAWLDGSWLAQAPPPTEAPRARAGRRVRVRCLGRAVVPQVARAAYLTLRHMGGA